MAAPSADEPLERTLRQRVRAEGPLPFSAFVEAALYDPTRGFYATGGHAGRRGDFLTSPEVGPLFGAVVARALDGWWHELGEPDPFTVVEAGAGPGTLARAVQRAAPECRRALVHVLVERSAAQRARHGEHLRGHRGEPSTEELAALVRTPRRGSGPAVASAADLPPGPVVGVVLANELLDNLPFDVLRGVGPATGVAAVRGVEELRVDERGDVLELVATPVPEPTDAQLDAVAGVGPGPWIPFQAEAARWVGEARALLAAGRVVVLDYAATDAELAAGAALGWLRTYVGHGRGSHPLDAPGSQDVTADVAVDQLLRARSGGVATPQAAWLRHHGIDGLVRDGRRRWAERAHVADLEAMAMRSRVAEAEALLDPEGLGGFTVVEWVVP